MRCARRIGIHAERQPGRRERERGAIGRGNPRADPCRTAGRPGTCRISRAEVRRSPPPGREGAIVVFGVERPDVEIFDAVLSVHKVQGSTLAYCTAQKAVGITS
jgi:hypothetical protein